MAGVVYYGPGGQGPFQMEDGVKQAPEGTLRVPLTDDETAVFTKITAAEITAGTEVEMRLMSPADIVALIAAHET